MQGNNHRMGREGKESVVKRKEREVGMRVNLWLRKGKYTLIGREEREGEVKERW